MRFFRGGVGHTHTRSGGTSQPDGSKKATVKKVKWVLGLAYGILGKVNLWCFKEQDSVIGMLRTEERMK